MKFSQIDPRDKLPIIIKKQNQIEDEIFGKLNKSRSIKMTKNHRFHQAERIITEASQLFTKNNNNNSQKHKEISEK